MTDVDLASVSSDIAKDMRQAIADEYASDMNTNIVRDQ
jgi:hypothetical protein